MDNLACVYFLPTFPRLVDTKAAINLIRGTYRVLRVSITPLYPLIRGFLIVTDKPISDDDKKALGIINWE